MYPLSCFGDHDSAILSNLISHPQATKPIKKKIYNWKPNLVELRKNVKEQMVKFVCGNTINTPFTLLYNNLVQKLSNCKKKFFQANVMCSLQST